MAATKRTLKPPEESSRPVGVRAKSILANLHEYATRGELIVFAGAGVSAGSPTALPPWKALAQEIVHVLVNRLETFLHRPDWLLQMKAVIDIERDDDRFPPEYQAQLIEEMSGERYFQALQALDVNILNASHRGIATLAKTGAIKAIVTTNFDRLIELALQEQGLPYEVAYDDAGFEKMAQMLSSGKTNFLPVIKIHGCVSNYRSMIDTLKQRKLGRSDKIERCLSSLYSGYWLYLGFSAADLESNPDYLGLRAGAGQSAGATYILYPGSNLRLGAKQLMAAYGKKGKVLAEETPVFLTQVAATLGVQKPVRITQPDSVVGTDIVLTNLHNWAETLVPAITGLCLAAVLESIGEAEAAFRILDRLVRKELLDERDTKDFHLLQLHHGRLGVACGQFFAVPDLNGRISNASFESTQSLLRIMKTEVGFAATSLWGNQLLWQNDGEEATKWAGWLMQGLPEEHWVGRLPRNKEDIVDAWIVAAQVCFINTHIHMLGAILDTVEKAITLARGCGDDVRLARVAALHLLALAETQENLFVFEKKYQAPFQEAARVGDGFALGMRSLAIGRWYVGAGRSILANFKDEKTIANLAILALQEAVICFKRQGMDPWIIFAVLQKAKAYMDVQDFDQASIHLNETRLSLNRFPIWASHFYEVEWQFRTMGRDANSGDSIQLAIQCANESGLHFRSNTLSKPPETPMS